MRLDTFIITFLVFTTFNVLMMIVAPGLAKRYYEKITATGKRIISYAFLVLVSCAFSGLVGSLSPEPHKTAICFASFGLIVLSTICILSLLFIATIPEEMEKESEEGLDKD